MIQIIIGQQTWVAPDLESAPEDCKNAMLACYARGEKPAFVNDSSPEPFTVAPSTVPAPTTSLVEMTEPPAPGVRVPLLPYSEGFGGKDIVDDTAKARIEAQHVALQAAGIDVAKASKDAHQVAASGTRMMREGYATQAARKAEHDAQRSIVDVAHEISTRVESEKRTDVEISAGELARQIVVNGKVHVGGRALTEQAIRGLAQRLESPMLGYVLGLRDRIAAARAEARRTDSKALTLEACSASCKLDLQKIAEVISHECMRNPNVRLKMRTRNGGVDDVYAMVSPSYEEADATTILPEILRVLPRDARGTFAYDPSSTQWEIRASVWTPTPVAEQAIGEAFEGYVSLRSRDNGTSRFRGDGGVTLIRCYNATTYNAGGAAVARVHKKGVSHDIRAMVQAAARSIDVLCQAWGKARTEEISMSAEERKQGDRFLHDMWIDMLRSKPLEGVLVGRKADHASALVSAYHAERRNPDTLVKADLAQAWTRYIQGQRPDIRRDAEAAIGSWIVGSA